MNHFLFLADATEYFNIFEYYVNKFNHTIMTAKVWLEFTIVLTFGFIVRSILLVRFEKNKLSDEDAQDPKKMKNVYIYCAGHVAYEWVIGYIVAYFVVKLSGSNDNLFMVNLLLAPAIGFIFAMLFDNKIIMKLEDSNNLANMATKETNIRRNSPAPTSSTPKESSPIVINVSNNPNDPKVNYEDKIPDTKPGISKINPEGANCDTNLAMKVIATVNTVIDRDKFQEKEIENIKETIADLEKAIDKLKEIEMNDKKLELKSLIYKCLNSGFALPQENDVIVTKYTSYRALNGNHEIQALYENHYLKLGVHEDRRKNNRQVENDRRNYNEIRVPYGMYDNEITIKEEKPLG